MSELIGYYVYIDGDEDSPEKVYLAEDVDGLLDAQAAEIERLREGLETVYVAFEVHCAGGGGGDPDLCANARKVASKYGLSWNNVDAALEEGRGDGMKLSEKIAREANALAEEGFEPEAKAWIDHAEALEAVAEAAENVDENFWLRTGPAESSDANRAAHDLKSALARLRELEAEAEAAYDTAVHAEDCDGEAWHRSYWFDYDNPPPPGTICVFCTAERNRGLLQEVNQALPALLDVVEAAERLSRHLPAPAVIPGERDLLDALARLRELENDH